MNENFNIMISLANQFEVDLRLQKLTELANLSDKYCNRAKTIFIERLNSLHAFMQQKKKVFQWIKKLTSIAGNIHTQ